jgi:hypothetical protein
MEFKTLLLIGTVVVFVITILRRIAKDEVVDLIGVSACGFLFILILVLSFLFEDSSVLWAILFGYWAGNAVCVNGDDD